MHVHLLFLQPLHLTPYSMVAVAVNSIASSDRDTIKSEVLIYSESKQTLLFTLLNILDIQGTTVRQESPASIDDKLWQM
jgi:hypothetical protein